jgi:hypothetical protein
VPLKSGHGVVHAKPSFRLVPTGRHVNFVAGCPAMVRTGSQVSDLNHVFGFFLDTLVLACTLPLSVSYERWVK